MRRRLKKRGSEVTGLKHIIMSAVVACFAQAAVAEHADGDAKRGETIFKKCRSCHKIGDGATNRVGPQLNLLFQRPAGSVEGFKYSPSMLRAGADGLIWDHASLDTYLENPKSLISKTDGFISKTGEDAALRKATYEESVGWYDGITADMFG